jgi:transposase
VIGLPSLRTLDGALVSRIWLAAEPTDMRCGFDRLAERVRTVIGQDPLGNGLFVFPSRSGDRLKILAWDRDGFVLWYKRLEAGVFKLPRVSPGSRSVELRASAFALTLCWSPMLYVEFTQRQDMEKLLNCLVHAFRYSAGITRRFLTDNIKTVVWNAWMGSRGFIPSSWTLPAITVSCYGPVIPTAPRSRARMNRASAS